MTDLTDTQEIASLAVESSTLAILNKSEIDQQIATAKRFPRALAQFRKDALAMATLSVETAGACIYSLPRDGKTVEGPSARFAEIVASSWGNCRVGARVMTDQGDFVTAQGVFHDLERNVAITYEVQRRIVDKKGHRFSLDMVGVTSNAACSIALRNAVLKGVPKAMWEPVYGAARSTVMGDFKTLGNRRAEALAQFQHYGVTKEMICELLGVGGVQDLVVEHLVTLRGLLTAIQDGDTTVEQAFAPKQAKASASATGKAAGSANTAAKVEAAGPDLNAALDQTPSEAKGPARTGAAKAPASQTETGKSDAMKPREDPRFTAARLIRAAESVRRLDELDPLEAEAQTLPEPQRSEVLGHLGTIRHHVPEGRVDTENGALFSE